jgi:thiamine-phosphate pyrophosphorylase
MIVVISPERNLPNETLWVNKLLEAGLDCFHIRKPNLDDMAVAKYIEQIEKKNYARIVIHDKPKVAQEYGINRFHYSERERNKVSLKSNEESILSTSVHSMETFNGLDSFWEYAFLSPIFSSISKRGYGVDADVANLLKLRINRKTKLIGLGGITPQNMHETLALGVDGVALLGAIWQSENPLHTFKLCKS